MVFSLILHNCAIELIPPEIKTHPNILRTCQKRRLTPSKTILDRAIHGKAMNCLPRANQRGRPDILHSTLQQITFSDLHKQKKLQSYVHLRDNYFFKIPHTWRPPANYNRFIPLFEQLLVRQQIPVKGTPIIKLKKGSLSDLINQIDPYKIYYLTSRAPTCYSLTDFMSKAHNLTGSVFLIGGFQNGSIELDKMWNLFALGKEPLPTSVITSKLLTMLEITMEIN